MVTRSLEPVLALDRSIVVCRSRVGIFHNVPHGLSADEPGSSADSIADDPGDCYNGLRSSV